MAHGLESVVRNLFGIVPTRAKSFFLAGAAATAILACNDVAAQPSTVWPPVSPLPTATAIRQPAAALPDTPEAYMTPVSSPTPENSPAATAAPPKKTPTPIVITYTPPTATATATATHTATPTKTATPTPVPKPDIYGNLNAELLGYNKDGTANYRLTLTVNSSSADAPAFYIALSGLERIVDSSGNKVDTLIVSGLKSGEQKTFELTAALNPGSYALNASLDSGNKVAEDSEGNNSLSEAINVERPILVEREVWEYTKELIDCEFGSCPKDTFMKMLDPAIIYVTGEQRYVDIFKSRVIPELVKLTGQEVTYTDNQNAANVVVYAGVPHSTFPDAFWEGQEGVWVSKLNRETFEIEGGTIAVSNESYNTPEAIEHLMMEEATQLLTGLGNDSFRHRDSIFQQNWTTVTKYSPLDEKVIRFVSNPAIKPGMTTAQVEKRLIFTD